MNTIKANATEILNQLGGRRFIAMTGSKEFLDMGDGLKMKLASNKSGAKYLYIQLLESDEYRMVFANIRNYEWKEVKVLDRVYCDQLQKLFTEVTGLYTRL